ncbi:hypothetical protein MLD38_038093 [Melastoma candidum]|uniref:Uncharacterized protein n=1 Tax=Melastoma candidum TaxID=119954 RepID=A0ACB9KXX8_9MYRT|nr:hypothetical protein MLD38_038093 [Melastoma candidum]
MMTVRQLMDLGLAHRLNAMFAAVKSAGNTFGNFFCVTTFGDSHVVVVGHVVDGCPSRLPLSVSDIQVDPCQSRVTSPWKETDTRSMSSGVYEGEDGLLLSFSFNPPDSRSFLAFQDYAPMHMVYRPSHADVAYDMKYGVGLVDVIVLVVIVIK